MKAQVYNEFSVIPRIKNRLEKNPDFNSDKKIIWIISSFEQKFKERLNSTEIIRNDLDFIIRFLTKELWLIETPEVKKLWITISESMNNNWDYYKLDWKYWDKIREIEKNTENKSEKTQIAVWLMTAKIRINWWKFEEALSDLDAMLEFADWMANMDSEYWEIWDKIYSIIKMLKK